MGQLTRRGILGGILVGAALPALAEAPRRSPRPEVRVSGKEALAGLPQAGGQPGVSPGAPSPQALIAQAKLGGQVGVAVADARSGRILESVGGDLAMPPASTAKTITALYALETLGADARFVTRLIATGPVKGGRLLGDLILAGGGDPTLSTDDLGAMAAELKARGLTGVEGRFLVWGGALPYVRAIDQSQPDYLGYNPAVSGLMLNYNRVNFVWERKGQGYELFMDARGERYAPRVVSARMSIVNRDLPVYTYSDRGKAEEWTVAASALGKGGSRWLPTRRPELYAGDVFQSLARAMGISLPAPQQVAALPAGTVLVQHASAPMATVLRDMLKYSNNLTAEAVGMAASLRRLPLARHAQSAPAMCDWLQQRTGVSARLVDHSGLGGASRVTPEAMVTALQRLGPQLQLRPLLKDFALRDAQGKTARQQAIAVDAKTGTLNFVSSLVGWMTAPDGTDLVFAIFTGDVARRDSIPEAQRERAPGNRAWVGRSKLLQSQLIERWAAVYGTA